MVSRKVSLACIGGSPPSPPGGYVPTYACLHPGGRGTRKIAAKKFPDTNTYPQKIPRVKMPDIQTGDLVKVENKHLEASHKLRSKNCWLVVETKVTYTGNLVALCIQGSRKEWISFGILEKV